MDWDRLRIFHDVAEAGSFTHAGATLNLSQSAVSRQVSALEDSLSVKLFHRHARGLILTEQGELLFHTTAHVFHELALVENRLREAKERPQGPLKVTTTVAFGSVWLTSRIKEFIEYYPDISLSLVLDDGETDISMREADVAIRMWPPRQPNLVQRHLMNVRYHIYAAPEYLDKHGVPETAAELDRHALIVYGESATPPVEQGNWLLETDLPRGRKRKAALRVNNVYGIFRAVQSGLGIGALPEYMSREVDNLIEILPQMRGPTFDTYFVYPEELRDSKRISVFRDFLLRKVAEAGLLHGPSKVA